MMATQGACGQFSGDDVLLEQPNTRLFRNGDDLGNGVLSISENEVTWKSSNQAEEVCLQYPCIIVHAVSRDTIQFPSACLFLLYEEVQESDDEDCDSDENRPCEIQLVPPDTNKLDVIYQTISECQELYPDPELSSDSQCSDNDEIQQSSDNEDESFFTSEEGLQHLTVNGQTVLAHLESILRVDNVEETNGDTQFEDADEQ